MNQAAAVMLAKSGEAAKSGPIGLAVILILCIACYFLFKSMSKHLKSVRTSFPAGATTPEGGAQPMGPAAEASHPADQPGDHPADQPGDHPADQPGDHPSERSVDQPADRPSAEA